MFVTIKYFISGVVAIVLRQIPNTVTPAVLELIMWATVVSDSQKSTCFSWVLG